MVSRATDFGNILLVAKDDMLYATASDKETTMEAKVELENLETPGSITIPAKLLLDILKEFPEQPLTFDINTATNEVKIISDKGEFSVPGESAEDYPVQSAMGDSVTAINTNCGMLLEGITRTVFATANDDLRPVMNCILVEMTRIISRSWLRMPTNWCVTNDLMPRPKEINSL